MICLLLAVDFVWASHVGLTIGGGEIFVGMIAALLAFSAAYRRRSCDIANMAEAGALWGALMSTGVVLTYLAASCALPLQDATMQRLDRVVGFDWLAWRDAMLSWPTLSWLLPIAYSSLQPQAALSIIYFAVSGRTARIGELLLLAGATLAVTDVISAIYPTLGPFAEHGGGDAGYVAYLPDLLALRAGGPWHFKLFAMQGIVQMPSYHVVMAVLFTYAFRGTGLIGYGIAALNMVMLLSIPPIGGHYLVDMLAGGALALGAIAIQRTQWHGVSRVLFGLRRETLVGKVLDSAQRGT
jgi:PAP2 superfamily